MIARLKAIASDPFAKHANVDTLVGEKDAFRLRQGGWRAVYKVDRAAGVMRVLRIEPRGEVYR
jgi:mRNA-degrading endonuclease RelE of RelBE toxin-antitoxin system